MHCITDRWRCIEMTDCGVIYSSSTYGSMPSTHGPAVVDCVRMSMLSRSTAAYAGLGLSRSGYGTDAVFPIAPLPPTSCVEGYARNDSIEDPLDMQMTGYEHGIL